MAGYNRIVMVGNLTRDPEVKSVGVQSVCKLSIAANKQYKNRQTGAVVNDVCFIDVEVWGGQVDSCKTYLQKGKQVLIEGRLKFDTWKDNEGQTRSKHSIVSERVIFLSGNKDEVASGELYDTNESLVKQDIRPSRGTSANQNKKGNSTNIDKDPQFVDSAPFTEDELPF